MLDNFADDKLDLYFIRNWYRIFKGFHCVILDLEDGQFLICSRNSDFQWLQELLFGFFRNTDISHNSPCSPVFPHQGGKIHGNTRQIHEIAVNLDNLSSFSWVILVQGTQATQATQAKDTQATLTHHTKRQRKFELFNPSQAWGAAQTRCNSAALSCDYITPPVALVQQSSGTEWQQAASSVHHMQQGSWAASLWHVDHITQQKQETLGLTSVICQINLLGHLPGCLLNHSQHPNQETCPSTNLQPSIAYQSLVLTENKPVEHSTI